jgi:hypothetical protein
MDILKLPSSLEVQGVQLAINADWRPCVNIMRMFERQDLTDSEKILCMVEILYVDEVPDSMVADAAEQAIWFLNLGDDPRAKASSKTSSTGRLFSWEQDLKYIISAVEHASHVSIRSQEFFHFWEFMSAFFETGECILNTLIHQRKLKKTGKQSKMDREWWAENKDIAELKVELTTDEQEVLEAFNALLKGGEQDG